MNTRYLCASYQGLLQQLVYLLGRGYYYYHITTFPLSKQDKWVQIDEKLIEKYQADKSKYQRARQKKKGLANFFYLRWEHIAIILRTNGDIAEDIVIDDKFSDLRYRKLRLEISQSVSFDVQFFQKKGESKYTLTVRFSKEMYRGIKDHLADVAKTKNKALMRAEFDRLNGFPAWAGIIAQKRHLAKYLVKQARKNNVKLNESDLRVEDKRKIYSVFD